MLTCREKFNKIFMSSRKCARMVGADVFRPDFRYTWLTKFVLFCIVGFFSLSGYTMFAEVYINADWSSMLKALCTVASGIQGTAKLLSGIDMQKEFRQMYNRLDRIYDIYEQKHSGYQNVLNDTSKLITKFLKYFGLLYVVVTMILPAIPIFYLVYFGEKMFVLQFMIPGVDATTDAGHLITICAHILCLAFGSFGNFAADMFFFIFLLHIPLMKNILRLKFEDLNEVLVSTRDRKRMNEMLVDILSWHQDYTSYTNEISQLYFGVTIAQISTTTVSIGLTLFIALKGDWPAGYAYMIYMTAILYTYCGLGTVVELANDDVCDYVYCTCLWYELPVKERKMLIMMMIKAQCPAVLDVGYVMPLSVTTGLSVTKTIYSFMMMLYNFDEN